MAAPMTERMDRREAEKWRWSSTALDRLGEYGFNESEVYYALLEPASRAPGNSPGTQVWTRDRVSAVVDPVKRVVVTVMDAYGTRPTLRRMAVYPDRVVQPPPPVQPSPVVAPEPEPTPYVVDIREVTNMAERIRLLSAEHAGEVPKAPVVWLRLVCLPRLRDYPGRWARLLSAPYASVAEPLAERIRPHLEADGGQIELTVRGPHIYGRSL